MSKVSEKEILEYLEKNLDPSTPHLNAQLVEIRKNLYTVYNNNIPHISKCIQKYLTINLPNYEKSYRLRAEYHIVREIYNQKKSFSRISNILLDKKIIAHKSWIYTYQDFLKYDLENNCVCANTENLSTKEQEKLNEWRKLVFGATTSPPIPVKKPSLPVLIKNQTLEDIKDETLKKETAAPIQVEAPMRFIKISLTKDDKTCHISIPLT